MNVKSWKTSSGGLAMILGGISSILTMLQGNAIDQNELMLAIGNIAGGWGLLCARDNNVSSEQAGVKPTDPKP